MSFVPRRDFHTAADWLYQGSRFLALTTHSITANILRIRETLSL